MFLLFLFLLLEKNFILNTNKQTTKLVWYSWATNCAAVYKRQPTKKTHFDGCDCVLLFVLCEGGFCIPLDWSGQPNKKAFRKLISVSRGERIHNNSLGNDEVPDGVRELLPLCKLKVKHCLFIFLSFGKFLNYKGIWKFTQKI